MAEKDSKKDMRIWEKLHPDLPANTPPQRKGARQKGDIEGIQKKHARKRDHLIRLRPSRLYRRRKDTVIKGTRGWEEEGHSPRSIVATREVYAQSLEERGKRASLKRRRSYRAKKHQGYAVNV